MLSQAVNILRLASKSASAAERAIHQRESGGERPALNLPAVSLSNPPNPPPPTVRPELVEGPPSIGPSNQSVMFCASRAKRVAVMLARRGYTIRKIVITPSLPTITLKSTVACRDLGGEQICHAVCDGQDNRTYAVLIDGVSVEWTVRKNLGEKP